MVTLHTKVSNYTISTCFHLVPVMEWGCLSPLLVESRLVSSKACFDHLLIAGYCARELRRKKEAGIQ